MDPALYVAGDPTATAGNLVANTGLARLTVVAHLMDAVFFVLTAATLYVLLKQVGKHAARLMVLPVVVAAGLISVSALFTFTALQVATTDTYVAAFGEVGADALALLQLEIEHYGIFAAQVFFGLWLAPLGYLAYRSRLFPKVLGITLVAATVSYLADVLVTFLLPDFTRADTRVSRDRARNGGNLDGLLPADHWRPLPADSVHFPPASFVVWDSANWIDRGLVRRGGRCACSHRSWRR